MAAKKVTETQKKTVAAAETKAEPSVKMEPVKEAPEKEVSASVEKTSEKEVAVKEPVKEEKTVKKAPARKTAPKKTAATKTTAKSKNATASVSQNVYIQYAGNEVLAKDILERAKQEWVDQGNKEADIKSIDLYVKPEDHAAYYVINGQDSGKLFL